ncbi:WecB/TagA/CpsF family glycosyltransferase [Sphingomonas profundi]|uniref:WecB/TagA/CpsF family glycosyltransferase n=1 Tax=Alterirhizorhabdus profundi TaxID=2681549 RepID=UPI0012E77334|nr:WecB/TagA/CpsF family glycosyltransferase [Sphingomonas profundi]
MSSSTAQAGNDPTARQRPQARPAASRRIGLLDVRVATAGEAVAQIVASVGAGEARIFGFCNAHTVNMAAADPAFANAAARATLFNDGIGVDLASRWLYGAPFPDNLNGTDLTPAVLAALPPGTPVYLLGSPPGVAAEAQAALAARFPQCRFVGADHGFLAPDDEPAVLARIQASGARLVLVGMGHPYQELWAARNVAPLGATIMCIGAFLDFSAGRVPRAPGWARRARIEWLYRLAVEPRRLARRYLIGNAAFLLAVARQRARRT